MRNYKLILGLLIKNMFKRTRRKSKAIIAVVISFAFLYLLFLAMMIFAISAYAQVFNNLGIISEFLTLLMVVIFFIVFVFGVITVLSYLYFSRDTEFFLSLPVKPSVIYMAKLSFIYLIEIVITFFLAVPAIITIGISLKLSAVFYIIMIPSALIIPAFPLLIASIISIPLMYAVSFFKKRAALSSVFTILLFALFFAAYYFGIMSLTTGNIDPGNAEALIESFKTMFINISTIFYPFYALAKLALLQPVWGLSAGLSALVNLLIFIVSGALLFMFTVFISNAIYKRTASNQLENSSKSSDKKGKDEVLSVKLSLIKKEFKTLLRTPSFALQCFSGIVLCPIILAFMVFFIGSADMIPSESGDAAIVSSISYYIFLGFLILFGTTCNVGALTSITREGETFYYSKLLPIDYKIQIKAKIVPYYIISMVACILGLIIIVIKYQIYLEGFIALIFFAVLNYGYVCLGIYFDLRNPKLKWTTPTEAVKHNKNANIVMMISMLVSMVWMAIMIFLSMAGIYGKLILWFVNFIIAIGLALLFHFKLFKNAETFYSRLPEYID